MATDAEIRARGLLYVPKQKYLQNPYELPPEETPVSEGIVNTNAFNNNAGGGFYTDDNRITNQNYNPNPLQDARFSNEMSFVGAPKTDANGRNPGQVGYDPSTAGVSYNTRTEAMKNMEMNNNVSRNNNRSPSLTGQNVTGNYYGLDEPEQSKFEQFVRNAPILGTGIKAVELGGKFLSKILPTSRRSYLENELGNQGVFVDDIGRIVQGKGDYNTAQNVMAGYGASSITQETLDKRIKMINDTIKRKTKSYDIKGKDYTTTKSFEDLTKRIGALNEYGDINNIVNKDADFIKKNPKEEEEFKFFDDNIITRFLKKKKSSNTTTGTDTTGDNDGATTGVSYDAPGDDNITDRRDSDFDGSVGLGTNANAVRAAMAERAANPGSKKGSAQSYNQNLADGGRAGYFFGGRVNYKAGGRTDAGPNRTTASKAGVGQINESGQKVSGGNFNNNNNNDGGSIKPTFYNDGVQVLTNRSELGFDYPTGLTKNFGVGQLSAILNAKKSLEEEKPEGFLQYDSSIGPVDTRFTYDTAVGPEFNANYVGDNFDIGVNNKTGLSANYTKDIGPGTFTAGGSYKPDGTYNAEGKYVISYANGGLASIL